jgi:hypothetical protein
MNQTLNQSIQQILNGLIPIPQLVQTANSLLPLFGMLGMLMIMIGLFMVIPARDRVLSDFARAGILAVCAVSSPWFLALAEESANALVGAIGSTVPGMDWLPVNNPGPNDLTMDYTKPFGVLAKYIAAAGTADFKPWDIWKWNEYIFRAGAVAFCGLVAALTVFIMQALLILQKLILILSVPLLPVFIGCLMLPAMHGTSVHFFKSVIATVCWPVAWAIVHIGTMAALGNIPALNLGSGVGEIMVACASLAITCCYMIVGTLAAPLLIYGMLTRGSNFAAGLMGGVAGAGAAHIVNISRSAGAVGGAAVGSLAGPSGVSAGALAGSHAGEMLALPASAVSSVGSSLSGNHAHPSSRSAAAADVAIQAIRRRA